MARPKAPPPLSGLEKAQQVLREKRLSGWKPTRKRQGSRQKAIEAHCRACAYDDLGTGTWRMQTQACPILDCPLWHFRPVSSKGE